MNNNEKQPIGFKKRLIYKAIAYVFEWLILYYETKETPRPLPDSVLKSPIQILPIKMPI